MWMKTSTAKKRKNVPIHTTEDHSGLEKDQLQNLAALDALTGCGSTSFFVECCKKLCYKVFQQYHGLLKSLGTGDLTNGTPRDAVIFNCKLCSVQYCGTVDMARSVMLRTDHKPKALPPTSDVHFSHQLSLQLSHKLSGPNIRQQFGNKLICSTSNYLHPRPWDGGLRTTC